MTGLLALITFEYEDVDSLAAWSLNFWDLFFKGKLDEFYIYTAQNVHGAAHQNCKGNYLWLLPLCVWNLPLWVVHTVSGTLLVTNFFSICWTKLFLYLLQIVTAYVSGKICVMLTADYEKAAVTMLLVMASPEILLSVGYVGQDEIVYISLMMISLYCFLKGYWKRCYLCMVCSVTLCPIMILPVLAVLLLKEKRITGLFLYIMGTVSPLLVFEFLYRNDQIYQEVDFFAQFIGEMLQGSTLSTRWGEISVSGIILCLVYFYCYFEPFSEKAEHNAKIIYIISLILVTVCFMMSDDFYRMFLYVPFLAVAIMISGQYMNINLFLFTGITYGRMFQAAGCCYPKNLNTVYIMKHSWITALCDYMGKSRYQGGTEDGIFLWKYMMKLGEALDPLRLIIRTCTVGAVGILLVINCYRYTKRYEMKMNQSVFLTMYTFCMPIVLVCYFWMLLH